MAEARESAGRSSLLATRPRDEDGIVWLVACIFMALALRVRQLGRGCDD
ncbi:MAG TPA: hypothetical protein VE476_10945 [Propionibacteriaceae bacterium]|jgi:hypothetical protein|nr:hypothetical protein [Propionibacteriaceae bacterium]